MKNIRAQHRSWRVRILRGSMKFELCVPWDGDRDSALHRAIEERDRFDLLHPVKIGVRPPRSNTGHRGISEVTKWWHNQPHDCFQVTYRDPGRTMKRFFYSTLEEREQALQQAIAYRQSLEAHA